MKHQCTMWEKVILVGVRYARKSLTVEFFGWLNYGDVTSGVEIFIPDKRDNA